MDFNALIDDVLASTQELQREIDFTEVKYKKYINQGYYDFVEQTGCIEDIIDVTTVSNQTSYSSTDEASIANIFAVNHVRHIENGVTEVGRPLRPYPGGYANLPEDFSYGKPDYYWVRGMRVKQQTSVNSKKIGTWPVDSASSNTLRL